MSFYTTEELLKRGEGSFIIAILLSEGADPDPTPNQKKIRKPSLKQEHIQGGGGNNGMEQNFKIRNKT